MFCALFYSWVTSICQLNVAALCSCYYRKHRNIHGIFNLAIWPNDVERKMGVWHMTYKNIATLVISVPAYRVNVRHGCLLPLSQTYP